MRNDGRHRRTPMGPLRTQQVENNGMMRPQPRTTSWIPLPLLGSSAKLLMFSLNSCYVLVDGATIYGMLSEKYTQYLVFSTICSVYRCGQAGGCMAAMGSLWDFEGLTPDAGSCG